ncbi:hypothetical protein AJ80_05086 [Polytolypa hystricis UAMH7299]|uniref:Uncharacterized protein n=1 Tax=Polytolypa hystricis (strain UAMH7299) TaxID=1447883 RepID=A0A2B7Y6U9_POLH7|nr:hypothetical protein AJ80_05086 [Polytolypa hystricis UAMH7299]
MQPSNFLQNDRVRYLDCQAPELDDSNRKLQNCLGIDLDYAQDEAVRMCGCSIKTQVFIQCDERMILDAFVTLEEPEIWEVESYCYNYLVR